MSHPTFRFLHTNSHSYVLNSPRKSEPTKRQAPHTQLFTKTEAQVHTPFLSLLMARCVALGIARCSPGLMSNRYSFFSQIPEWWFLRCLAIFKEHESQSSHIGSRSGNVREGHPSSPRGLPPAFPANGIALHRLRPTHNSTG